MTVEGEHGGSASGPRTSPAGRQPAVSPALRRRRQGRVVAGVAGGLADHLGVDVLWVRAAFTALAGLGGAGVVAYGLLWVFVPARPVGRDQPESPRERQQAIAMVAFGVALTVAAGAFGSFVSTWITGPIGIALVGAAVVWREADAGQRRQWKAGARSGVVGVLLGEGRRTAVLVRVLLGGLLIAAGIAIFVWAGRDLGRIQFALISVLATLVGVALLTVPWWLRLVRDLNEERRMRIRTEERSEIAAHLHDSVLQTLALIQKHGEDSREVRKLARRQERELRSWLYGATGYSRVGRNVPEDGGVAHAEAAPAAAGTVATALAKAAGEVEDTFAITVQQVAVGDCQLTDRLLALVHAAREAMVNAAKHAGVDEISVYAEVEPHRVDIYVRDRGGGFDPDTVPPDRHGLADSIRGRMDRHGGTVRLRTAMGAGTEVQLGMPRETVTEAR